MKPTAGVPLQWLLLVSLLGWHRLSAGGLVQADESAECRELHDANGRWYGSRAVGGQYTLRCAPGFQVIGTQRKSFETVSCPENLEWPAVLKCEDIDNCADLKHGCGAKGICVDLVGSYDCNCEKGYQRHRAPNGEIVCGDEATEGICDGNTCGPYGLCIDLPAMSRKANQASALGGLADKCECAEGFFYNGQTCVRYDCGALQDAFGTWSGSTLFGEEYTLRCPENTFVWDSEALREFTMSCTSEGKWPSHPSCDSPALDAQDAQLDSLRFGVSLGCALLCVCCAALAAGLTLGLGTLEPFGLTVITATCPQHCLTKEAKAKLRSDQSNAKFVLPLVQDHHRLLVTLMLFNTIANEALPIFLDELLPSWAAVLVSVTAVLICGEILPSAVFTGPSRLRIAGAFVPLVRLLQWLFHYVSKPLIIMLDHLIGQEDPEGCIKYSRAELLALLRLHATGAGGDEEGGHAPRAGGHALGGSGALACLLTSEGPEEGAPEHCHDGGGHTESCEILAPSELRLIDGAFGLQDMLLDTVPFAKRRHCTLGRDEQVAAELLVQGRGLQGRRAVLVLGGGHDADVPLLQQSANPSLRCPLVTASQVSGCLRLRDVLRGGHRTLGSLCTEQLVLIPDTLTALGALKLLDKCGSSLGIVICGDSDDGAVLGVISQAEILSSMLCRPNAAAGFGEPLVRNHSDDSFTNSTVPSPSKRYVVGRRPLLRRGSTYDILSRTLPTG